MLWFKFPCHFLALVVCERAPTQPWVLPHQCSLSATNAIYVDICQAIGITSSCLSKAAAGVLTSAIGCRW